VGNFDLKGRGAGSVNWVLGGVGTEKKSQRVENSLAQTETSPLVILKA
jgi:hypothetical protein